MAKEPKSLHVKQPSDLPGIGAAPRQETFPVAVTSKQLDSVHDYITGRIRQHLQEITYAYQPGAIAGMLSDLRALQFIDPMDLSDKGIITGPAPEVDAAAKALASERSHNAAEVRRLAQ